MKLRETSFKLGNFPCILQLNYRGADIVHPTYVPAGLPRVYSSSSMWLHLLLPTLHLLHTLLLQGVNNSEQFFIMDWPVALYNGKGFCMVVNWIKLFTSVDNVVLRQDTSNCLIASISFHKCLEGSIELGKDVILEQSCSKFIKGLLLCMSRSKGNIFCQVN